MRVELERFDEVPVWRQFGGVADISERFRVSEAIGQQAVADMYELSYTLFAPYYYSLTDAMYPDLYRDVTRGGPVVVGGFGRDSHASSAALAGSKPVFHENYCRDVVMSRITASVAYRNGRDLGVIRPSSPAEQAWQERVFSSHGFAEDATGRFGRMESYLQRRGLPVDSRGEGGTVIVHDFACANGTTQEFLRAAFPRTRFIGRYATTWLDPGDPHHDEKHGYIWHGDAVKYPDGVPGRANTAVSYACWIPESILSGPWGTAVDMRPEGPVQNLDDSSRANRALRVKFDPRLYGAYRPWNVWAAGKTAALLAVYDYAKHHAGREPAWNFSEIQQGRDPLSRSMRGWTFAASGDPVDDHVRTIFDAYVPRRALGPDETMKPGLAGEPRKESVSVIAPAATAKRIARTLRPAARARSGTGSAPLLKRAHNVGERFTPTQDEHASRSKSRRAPGVSANLNKAK